MAHTDTHTHKAAAAHKNVCVCVHVCEISKPVFRHACVHLSRASREMLESMCVVPSVVVHFRFSWRVVYVCYVWLIFGLHSHRDVELVARAMI